MIIYVSVESKIEELWYIWIFWLNFKKFVMEEMKLKGEKIIECI